MYIQKKQTARQTEGQTVGDVMNKSKKKRNNVVVLVGKGLGGRDKTIYKCIERKRIGEKDDLQVFRS